jgi:hypothetical protein
MNKKRTASKSPVKPLSKSESEVVPLDLLCAVAWRLAEGSLSQGFKHWDGTLDHRLDLEEGLDAVWIQSLERADDMIREAIRVRQMKSQTYSGGEYFKQWTAEKILPLLTAEEKETNKVSYERGCQLITGLKKKRDATQRFELLTEVTGTDFFWDSAPKLRERGFSVDELARRVRMHQELPKNLVRKPYQKSGRFARKPQTGKKTRKR